MKMKPCINCKHPDAQTVLTNIAVRLHNSSVSLQSEEKMHRETVRRYDDLLKEKNWEIDRLKHKLQRHVAKHGAWKRAAKYWEDKYTRVLRYTLGFAKKEEI